MRTVGELGDLDETAVDGDEQARQLGVELFIDLGLVDAGTIGRRLVAQLLDAIGQRRGTETLQAIGLGC